MVQGQLFAPRRYVVRHGLAIGSFAVCSALMGCAFPLRTTKKPAVTVTAEQRRALIRRAQVWKPTQVSTMDIRSGPAHDASYHTGSTVACTFAEKHFGGHTPKFACRIGSNQEVVKVRYGADNGEVYANVAATRLMWALGFGADRVYPVRVECRGCPDQLGESESGVTTFEIAAIENPYPGRDIEASSVGPGWSWPELDLIDPAEGGAPAEQRDALKLLAVLLQHTDSKPEQQRLLCPDRPKSREELAACAEPFMMIHDVGQTFGTANLLNRATIGSVNFEKWSSTPIWKDRAHCIANLGQSQTGTLTDPIISEAGRKFLADLLGQLTDQQIHDLFAVARFEAKRNGGGPVESWVAAFKEKRTEIASVSCP
jgi:hypothetical protein